LALVEIQKPDANKFCPPLFWMKPLNEAELLVILET
jgi:hypothetical protein